MGKYKLVVFDLDGTILHTSPGVLASVKDPSYIPMVLCFVMFFANDMYGFVNWTRMRRRQKQNG